MMAALTRLIPTRMFEHVSCNFSSRSLLGVVSNFDEHTRRWVRTNSLENDLDMLDRLPDESSLEEETLNKIRNISRLNPADLNRVHNTQPFSEPMHPCHYTVRYHRRMLGRYGGVTGVDPGLCWPTKADLEDMKEYERVAYGHDILEVAKREAAKVEAEEKARRKWDEEIAKRVAKLPEIKAQLLAKRAQAKQLLDQAKARRQSLIQIVDEHFNYAVPHKEDRFKEELKLRMQEIKDKERLARKAEREERKAAIKLQQKEKLKEKAAADMAAKEAEGTKEDANIKVTEEPKQD